MKSKFQTYNQKKQHLNVEVRNFPLLSAYLDTIDISLYPNKPVAVANGQASFFNKSSAVIELTYPEFKPLADEYAKETKLAGEPNYIPVIIKTNGFVISITYK